MIMNRIRNVCSYFLMIILIFPSSHFVHPQSFLRSLPSVVEAPKIWNNTPSVSFYSSGFASTVNPILAEGTFVCGLHCNEDMDNCLFGISILNTSRFGSLQLVWSANRNNPVDQQAVLKLTSEGELVLKDANDTLVWSAGKAGNSVSRLSLSAEGNLMMLNRTNHVVWQSFDHPADSILRGQKLVSGQKLRASESLYAFGIINGRFSAYMDTDPSQIYYKDYYNSSQYYTAEFQTGRFGDLCVPNSTKLIQFESDGYLRAYDWNSNDYNWDGTDILNLDRCSYPSACGTYGVCSEGVCNCPD